MAGVVIATRESEAPVVSMGSPIESLVVIVKPDNAPVVMGFEKSVTYNVMDAPVAATVVSV